MATGIGLHSFEDELRDDEERARQQRVAQQTVVEEVTSFDDPVDATFDDEPLPATPIGDVAREFTQAMQTAPPLVTTAPSPVAVDAAVDAVANRVAAVAVSEARTTGAQLTKLEPRVRSLVDTVKAMKVTDAITYTALAAEARLIKQLQKEVDATFDPIIEAQRKALDTAREQKKRHADPLEEAETYAKNTLRAWDDEQKRLAEEEQRRIEAAQLAEAHSRRLDDAFEAEAAGDSAGAEEIMRAPVITAPVTTRRATPKIAGLVHKANWKGECTDLAKLVIAAAAELQNPDRTRPRLAFSLLTHNQAELTKQAKALKAELNRVPGVRAWDDGTTSIKA